MATLPVRRHQLWQYCTIVVAVSVTYLLTARLSFPALCTGLQASPLWTPAGIALAALLLYGRQYWGGVAIGAFLVSLTLAVPWHIAAVACLGNAFQALAGECLLRWYKVDFMLRHVQDVLLFIVLAVIATPMVNATCATIHGYGVGYVSSDRIIIGLTQLDDFSRAAPARNRPKSRKFIASA